MKMPTYLHGGGLKIFFLINIFNFLRHNLHPIGGTFDTLISRLIELNLLLSKVTLNTLFFKIIQTLQVFLFKEQFQTIITRYIQS